MSSPNDPSASPRVLLSQAEAQFGQHTIATWCAELLTGRVAFDDPESPSLEWLGGRPARGLLAGQWGIDEQGHWPRVWGARGLLYVWAPEAVPAVCQGLSDSAWRVREMSAKVIRHREVGEAADLLPVMSHDSNARVRAAALRALGAVGEAEGAQAIHVGIDDSHPAVREAAETALEQLSKRLDRQL